MNQPASPHASLAESPPGIAGSPLERFAAYRAARTALSLAAPLARGWRAELRDQAERAALSVVLNLAEGAGQQPGSPSRRRCYRIALGSALELVAALDAASLVAPDAGLAAAQVAAQQAYALTAALVRAQGR